MYITIGEETHTVTMEDNVGTRALVAALQTDNITYLAHDYGNFEKVGYVGQSFPTSNQQTTTSAGDLVSYTTATTSAFSMAPTRGSTPVWANSTDFRLTRCVRFVKAGEGEVSVTLSLQPIHTGIQELSHSSKQRRNILHHYRDCIAPKGHKGIVHSKREKKEKY